MQLVFYGRQLTSATAPGTPWLTVERKGVFSLNTAAVEALGLTPASSLVLASDAETNTWYVLLQVPAGEQSFALKPRDSKSSKALIFHSQPQARAYWAAHGLNGQKSVRALVSATPVEHDGLKLYPLSPQHLSVAQALPAPVAVSQPAAVVPAPAEAASTQQEEKPAAAPIEAVSETAPSSARQVSLFTAEQDEALLDPDQLAGTLSQAWGIPVASLYARRSYLKKQRAKTTDASPAAPAVPAGPQLVYTPAPVAGESDGEPQRKTFGLHARAEELTAQWGERELSQTSPNELAEVLNLLRHVPGSKRSIEMTLVLGRAEAEHQHRLTAAGKGGNRG